MRALQSYDLILLVVVDNLLATNLLFISCEKRQSLPNFEEINWGFKVLSGDANISRNTANDSKLGEILRTFFDDSQETSRHHNASRFHVLTSVWEFSGPCVQLTAYS